jgi:3D (Asp-Asp-Asp) domain-containing protein
VAESKEESLKPRSIWGLGIMFAIVMLGVNPTSTRAYIPYVQPSIIHRPLPEVKKEQFIIIKKVKGYGTGYFGPLEEDYATRKEYLAATKINGEGRITRSGTKPRIGTIAADKGVYPFGTIIFVPEINLMVTVEDTGSKVKGARHIDIFCGHGKNAERIANTWGPGTPITLVIMKKIEV